jgi:apolipoprotein D and lipocalin family protein
MVVAMLLVAGQALAQGAQPVPHLDLKQIIGKWYEIARLPEKSEKKCVGDAIVLYAEGNKPWRFSMVTSCRLKDGTTDVHNFTGRETHKVADGQLELNKLLIFHTKHWVLGIAPDDQWVLVGSPNHKNLWILARTSTLSAEAMTQIKGIAAAQGFDVGKLVVGPQD